MSRWDNRTHTARAIKAFVRRLLRICKRPDRSLTYANSAWMYWLSILSTASIPGPFDAWRRKSCYRWQILAQIASAGCQLDHVPIMRKSPF